MKIRFSISLKLLLLILPLVCLPIAIVGYLSTQASVDRVNRLVRHEQMVAVKTTANRINDVFYYCRLDLDTISRLPVLEDYHIARSFRLEAESEFNYDNIVRLFKDFIARTPYYYQIGYIDNQGQELIKVQRNGPAKERRSQRDQLFFKRASAMKHEQVYISDILRTPPWEGYVIHWAKPIFSAWQEFCGVLFIDLDYEKIIDIVKQIHVGERGYAFLIDDLGRNVAHPRFKPYRYQLDNYSDPSLRDLVLKMMQGSSEWGFYNFEGERKMAAYAQIPTMRWSLAVTIPSDELTKEAKAIQRRAIELVLMALVFAMIGVSVLSYYLLRPVRNLVTATNQIANGDLDQEIPVQSRDELGDLTRSFNRMVRNLSRIHNELVRSEKLISLGRLSAGVAHEIRNPLNAMKGAIVYLQRRRATDSLIKEYTQLVLEEIDRLSNFVTEFLYFARQNVPELVPTDLNKLILSVRSLFENQAEERGIAFRVHLAPYPFFVPADPKQLEQVLVNLFINAIDAMPGGGKLTVRSSILKRGEGSNTRNLIRITVEDNGVGIPKEHLGNIFDPFFSTKEMGTGLGLPLSLGIIEAHRGKLRISSHEGKGTAAVIELPLKEDKKEEEKGFEEETNTGSR